MDIVYRAQHNFSEYFAATNPTWFRKLVNIRKDFEVGEIQMKMLSTALKHIHEERERRKNAGIKLGTINLSVTRGTDDLSEARRFTYDVNIKYQHFLLWLDKTEETIRKSLATMQVSRELAMTVSNRDLDYYNKTAINPDEDRLIELHFVVDEKVNSL
jgi:hypothetical protein